MAEKWIAFEYWTVFNYGGLLTLCDRSKSLAAAERKARICERAGGAPHRILYVQECGRSGRKEPKGKR